MTALRLMPPTATPPFDDWYDDEPEDRCAACDGPLDLNEHYVCDECTGLRHCVDDMCHGAGYCLHDPKAWQP